MEKRYQEDMKRLKECMKRAEGGGELTIGFLGGSITQGSLASEQGKTYARRVFAWWKETFPQAVFHYVNGGIGGTTSHYGAARAVTDLLMYQPDFVVVDFSVNDEGNSFFQETYEGVVRRLLSWPSSPAVVLLHNVFYDSGANAQETHDKVGEWYALPYVSIRDTVYRRMEKGEFALEELMPDGLHPNDKGHELIAGEIIRLLNRGKEEADAERRAGWPKLNVEGPERAKPIKEGEDEKPGMVSLGKTEKKVLPRPMTANCYEHAKRLTIREISPILDGFRADTEEKQGHLDAFKNGWIGKKAGDRIVFELEASCIAVQYRKSVKKPALRAALVLDGDNDHPVLLDGNFEEDWGDCQYLQPVLHHGKRKRHRIEICILQDGAKEAVSFYLMGIIVA